MKKAAILTWRGGRCLTHSAGLGLKEEEKRTEKGEDVKMVLMTTMVASILLLTGSGDSGGRGESGDDYYDNV
eukprot:6183458-Pleurochrysis_carterae.AAC.2